jgi:hypothetical protein
VKAELPELRGGNELAKRTCALAQDAPPRDAEPPIEPGPVIDVYKAHVDRTLIRAQLQRTIDERVQNRIASLRFAEELRRAERERGRS